MLFFSSHTYHVPFAQLLSGSFPWHPLHPVFHAAPCSTSYVGSPFSCLLCNSQVPVKATQNSSIRYLSDCIMDIMDHICMSHHWIVLSTANFRLQIFSQEQMSLRSSNFTFGTTWLLRGRQNPFSCLLSHFYLFIYLFSKWFRSRS